MTEIEFMKWLKDDTAIRVVLVEAQVESGGQNLVRYMSNKGYVSRPTDTIPNRAYQGIIEGGVSVTEEVGLTGSASLSYGDIEINNSSGALDSWLDDVWTNRGIEVYLGDKSWSRNDFKLVYRGIIADVACRTRHRINLKLRDMLQRLNAPVTEATLGGTTDNKDEVIPVTLGEVHNIEPLLVDPALEKYKFHDGPAEALIEVRDNGVPVTVTVSLADGTFRLTGTAAGQITASVQGHSASGYTNRVAGLIHRLVTAYGKASDRFSASDIDTANLNAFESSYPQPVGIHINSKENLLETCNRIAESIGAQVIASREGKLRMLRVDFPPPGVPVDIRPQNMVDQSLKLADMSKIEASVKLGYCQNWTTQTGLETGLPDTAKELFASEWLSTTVNNPAVATQYKLTVLPEQEDTLLLTEADAIVEANRRLALRSTRRKTYEFTGFPETLTLELGQTVRLWHPRFGLKNGVLGVVVRLQPDWMKSRNTIQVMI